MAMRRLLLLGVGLLPVLFFGLAGDAAAGEGGGWHTLTTTLHGANEIPLAKNSDLRGTAKVRINLDSNVLCWDLDYRTKTQHVVAAHIHIGKAGTAPAMNIVFGFFNPPASPTPVNDGCRAGDPTLLRNIVANPQNYYVNVHTTIHPAGAGRGQLRGRDESDDGDD
jgi:hypothetical protein